MLSRTRILAAVTLLFGCLTGSLAWAQAQNLEAGKSPSQLFAGTCNACHKSPRGLLKTVSPGSLPGFLRDHYTTGSDMASQLAAFLISNGAGDNRQSRQGGDAKQGATSDQSDRFGRKPRNAPSQEAGRPAADNPPQGEIGQQGRKRFARPSDGTEETKPLPNAPPQAGIERGPDGRKMNGKRRGRPGDEVPVAEPPKDEPAMTDQARDEAAKEGRSATEGGATGSDNRSTDAKSGDVKPNDAKSNDAKPETAKARPEALPENAGGDKPIARRDPVPAVTPAQSTPTPLPATGSAPSEAAASAPKPPSAGAEPPAVTASAPPPPRPAGPPAPPISQ